MWGVIDKACLFKDPWELREQQCLRAECLREAGRTTEQAVGMRRG